jgi:hypothetical protein
MTTTAMEIAQAIREAGGDRKASSELMASLYDETITLQHVPPSPSDGQIPRNLLIAVSQREVTTLQRAFPDAPVHRPEVTVEGERIRVRGRFEGTAADGTRVDIKTNTVFTVEAGRIIALSSEMDPEATLAWASVLKEGSSEMPEEPETPF